ncbi:acyl dehydratase [Chitinivorax tropicus]|uniref:Acyl dehydratase n=1 Tax=Chitinivorax tropicus TaxID=714531 RepID=A0A840MJG2_9PROT|nr:MaoC family dehydratase [Chitinivorax tropicus]MBB5018550.1 acyl dehydratase [Chitinivorax tropicus]
MSESKLYFEDLNPGRVFQGGPVTLGVEELTTFASQYDPQPFHLTESGGRASVFGSLVASGWQTASLTMRMFTSSDLKRVANGLIGLQIDKLTFHQPVRPGDVLRAEFDVLNRKRSQSKPGFGVVHTGWRTYNQQGSMVLSLECAIWVATRPSGANDEVSV